MVAFALASLLIPLVGAAPGPPRYIARRQISLQPSVGTAASVKMSASGASATVITTAKPTGNSPIGDGSAAASSIAAAVQDIWEGFKGPITWTLPVTAVGKSTTVTTNWPALETETEVFYQAGEEVSMIQPFPTVSGAPRPTQTSTTGVQCAYPDGDSRLTQPYRNEAGLGLLGWLAPDFHLSQTNRVRTWKIKYNLFLQSRGGIFVSAELEGKCSQISGDYVIGGIMLFKNLAAMVLTQCKGLDAPYFGGETVIDVHPDCNYRVKVQPYIETSSPGSPAQGSQTPTSATLPSGVAGIGTSKVTTESKPTTRPASSGSVVSSTPSSIPTGSSSSLLASASVQSSSVASSKAPSSSGVGAQSSGGSTAPISAVVATASRTATTTASISSNT